MVIVAIGGCVIKTAWEEIKELAKRKRFDLLIHSGASIFHDFHRAMDKNLKTHSFTLDEMIEDYTRIRRYANKVWAFLYWATPPPKNSLTYICEDMGIEIQTIVVPGCDFWHLFLARKDWCDLGLFNSDAFYALKTRLSRKTQPITFISLGSAVVIPEFFIKVIALTKRTNIETITVDFLDMYRPRTRLAKYGKYFQMPVKDFLKYWIEYENFDIRNNKRG